MQKVSTDTAAAGGADEAQRLERCRRGDPAAWEELFERHYAAVGRFVCQLSPTFSREDVEEVCQEVFLSVVKHLHAFHGASAFQTWVFRIAANKARDFRERQTAAKRGGGQATVSLSAGDPQTEFVFEPSSPAPGPDVVLMKAEQMHLVRRALDRVGDTCREILELRYFGDLSYEELATSLKLNPKTVSSRLSKCLDRLARIWEGLVAEEDREGREASGPFPV